MAVQQTRLYRHTNPTGDPIDGTGENVILIQQHTTFVEIITEGNAEIENITEFAAVVGLVKMCKNVERKFDNAVLWFTDNFLFGNKTSFRGNVTPKPLKGPGHDFIANYSVPTNDTNHSNVTFNNSGPHPDFLGKNPVRTHNNTTLLKEHDHNDPTDTHDGFIRHNSLEERWGGCFIPDGFAVFTGPIPADCTILLAAINTGQNATLGTKRGNQACDEDDLDEPEDIAGCAAQQQADRYDTAREQVGNRLESLGVPNPIPERGSCGPTPSEVVRMTMAQDNNCGGCMFDYLGSLFITDPNDHRWIVDAFQGRSNSLLSGVPVAVVHLQVDPKNPDRQGFPDEALWVYREDGRARLGMPYNENPNADGTGEYCHDRATVDKQPRWAPYDDDHRFPISSTNKTLYDEKNEKDFERFDDRQGAEAFHFERPYKPYPTWNLYNHTGNTLPCSIEYNFLGGIDFRIFGTGGGGAEHGRGGADDNTRAWQGNSHPHNPTDCPSAGWDGYNGTYGNERVQSHPNQSACPSGPFHEHSSATVDIYFARQGPWFTMTNPYWDEFGGPVDPMFRCVGTARNKILVCDKRTDEFFHLHDGSESIPPS